jgi:hypothetical protein
MLGKVPGRHAQRPGILLDLRHSVVHQHQPVGGQTLAASFPSAHPNRDCSQGVGRREVFPLETSCRSTIISSCHPFTCDSAAGRPGPARLRSGPSAASTQTSTISAPSDVRDEVVAASGTCPPAGVGP